MVRSTPNLDFKYKKLNHIFSRLFPEGKVPFMHLAMLLVLMRYPMPTAQELQRFRDAVIPKATTKQEFALCLGWLDEYDEIHHADEITERTSFMTGKVKELLYWVFSYKDGVFRSDLLFHFLEKHLSPHPLNKYYYDYFEFGM
jgi:hypothetical protein